MSAAPTMQCTISSPGALFYLPYPLRDAWDLSRLPTRVPAASSLAGWIMPFCVAWALLLKILSRCTESPMVMGLPRLVPLAWKSSTYVERRPVPVDLCRRCCTYAIPCSSLLSDRDLGLVRVGGFVGCCLELASCLGHSVVEWVRVPA
jgi:hypothetical protein